MRIEVLQGDATAVEGDVLALKYAQARYGLDGHVAQRLRDAGYSDAVLTPEPGGASLAPSSRCRCQIDPLRGRRTPDEVQISPDPYVRENGPLVLGQSTA